MSWSKEREMVEVLEEFIKPFVNTYFDLCEDGAEDYCDTSIIYEGGKLRCALGKIPAGTTFSSLEFEKVTTGKIKVNITFPLYAPNPSSGGEIWITNPALTQIDPETYPYREISEQEGIDSLCEEPEIFDITPYLPLDLGVVLQELQDLRLDNERLKRENELLQTQVEYQPEGEGFKECKEHFEKLSGKID